MPGTSATGSTKIALVNSRIIANLCDGKFYIDASPSVYIADGETAVLGANVRITNPYGVVIKPFGNNYEIAPDLSGGMDVAIAFNIPTQAGNFQYGKYKVELEMFDDSGSWIVEKFVSICEPDKNKKTRNYGSLSADLNGSCVDGKLYVLIDGVPNYNGQIVESKTLAGELEYPTSSGLDVLEFSNGSFAVTLFEGVYKVAGEICAVYNFGDDVYVNVKYKFKKEKNIRCLIDKCCVFSKLQELHKRTASDCTDEEKSLTASITVDALRLMETAELAGNCGEDPSEYISALEELLGCSCTCNCLEGTPIVNNTPSSDVIIEGCNVSVSENGLTKTYTINNYSYKVEINENGGALVVSSGTVNGCEVVQLITFNIATVYSQIKTLANQNNTEADFWASVINKSLTDIDPACLGITDVAWVALSFKGKWEAVLAKLCSCCGTCSATIENAEVVESGNDFLITWEGVAYLYEIYLDGILQASILTSAFPADPFFYTIIGVADGKPHNVMIVSKCMDLSIGETWVYTIQKLGCPEIAATIFDGVTPDAGGNIIVNDSCPFDLNSIVDLSNPLDVEWHNANNINKETKVENPSSVNGGTYYAFNKTEGNCFSPSTRVVVICNSLASCTAPQKLIVGSFGSYDFFVQFQSAAYPPPGNSYTIKRRLASDPDISGSYTTIGSPTWNASLNRWVIADLTASNNTLYVYRAISNCGSTEPSIDYVYSNVVCPAVTLTPTDNSVGYSFVPVSGASEMFVDIYDSTETSLIHRDTHTPAFSSPTTGTFEYLDPGTTYKVKLTIVLASGSAEIITSCVSQSVTTDLP